MQNGFAAPTGFPESRNGTMKPGAALAPEEGVRPAVAPLAVHAPRPSPPDNDGGADMMRKRLSEQREVIKELMQELQEEREHNRLLAESIPQLQTSIQREVDVLVTDNTALRTEVEALRTKPRPSDATSSSEVLSALQSAFEAERRLSTELAEEVGSLEEQLRQAAEAKRQWERERELLLGSAEQSPDAATHQWGAVVAKLREERNSMEEEMNTMRQALDEVATQCAALVQERQAPTPAPKGDPERIASLESLVASLKKELLTKARDAEKWRGSMMAERDRRMVLEQTVRQIERDLQLATASLQQHTGRAEELQRQAKEARAAAEAAAAEAADLKARLADHLAKAEEMARTPPVPPAPEIVSRLLRLCAEDDLAPGPPAPFCGKCGAALFASGRFCSLCGHANGDSRTASPRAEIHTGSLKASDRRTDADSPPAAKAKARARSGDRAPGKPPVAASARPPDTASPSERDNPGLQGLPRRGRKGDPRPPDLPALRSITPRRIRFRPTFAVCTTPQTQRSHSVEPALRASSPAKAHHPPRRTGSPSVTGRGGSPLAGDPAPPWHDRDADVTRLVVHLQGMRPRPFGLPQANAVLALVRPIMDRVKEQTGGQGEAPLQALEHYHSLEEDICFALDYCEQRLALPFELWHNVLVSMEALCKALVPEAEVYDYLMQRVPQ